MEEIGEGILVAEQIAHLLGGHRAIAALSAAGAAAKTPLARIESTRRGAASRALRLLVHLPVRSELIVFLALLAIADDFVGFVDLLELRFGGFVAGVDVGMVLARQLAEGLLDFLLTRIFCDAKRGVVVFEIHRVVPQTRPYQQA